MTPCRTYDNRAHNDIIAKTKCPLYKKIVYTNCEGCISGNILIHDHLAKKNNDGIPDFFNVKLKMVKGYDSYGA